VIPLGGIEPGSQSQVVHDLVHQNGVLGSKLGIEVEFDSPHLHQIHLFMLHDNALIFWDRGSLYYIQNLTFNLFQNKWM